MKLKTLLLTFTAAAILAVVPSQAKAQMVVPDPRACIYTGCGTVPGLCYVITTPCISSYGGNAWEAMYMWLVINAPWVLSYYY